MGLCFIFIAQEMGCQNWWWSTLRSHNLTHSTVYILNVNNTKSQKLVVKINLSHLVQTSTSVGIPFSKIFNTFCPKELPTFEASYLVLNIEHVGSVYLGWAETHNTCDFHLRVLVTPELCKISLLLLPNDSLLDI